MEFESPEACRAFDHYRSQSAPILGNILDSEFWGGLVMRLSVTEPVVRHAVLALSKLHEHIGAASCDEVAVGPEFAFAEYGKSIDALRKWKGGPVVPLLACVLFVCIEFMLDNEEATKLHIFQGRQLLCALEDEAEHTRDMIKRELVPMYTRLGLAAFLYGVRPPRVPQFLRIPLTPPASYDDIAQARGHLYHILDEALRFSTSVKPQLYADTVDSQEMELLQAEQRRILLHLEQWNASFTVLTTSQKMSQASSSVQSLLRMYYNAAVIWTSTALSTREVDYDAHISSFASIISHAASIINASRRGSRLQAFSFETELVAPIYWTITKCRHPALRRAALRLLMRDELRGRRENLWHSQEAIAVSWRAIQIEEQRESDARMSVVKDAGQSTPASQASSPLSFKSNLFVPTSKPPTTTVEHPINFLDSDSTPDPDIDESYPPSFYDDICAATIPPPPIDIFTDMSEDQAELVSPYGVLEIKRINNILIGPRDNSGVWITIFKDPESNEGQWNVTKEYVLFEA